MPQSATSESTGRPRGKYAATVVIIVVLLLYGGYLWWISGVLPVVERFPNGKPQTTGYVKRYGGRYERTGRWTTFHPNEKKASEGMYDRDTKVPGTWHYWDEAGKEIAPETGSDAHKQK